jgi:hypothetical protein
MGAAESEGLSPVTTEHKKAKEKICLFFDADMSFMVFLFREMNIFKYIRDSF